MNKRQTGIEELSLSTVTYDHVKVTPTYVNFLFGNNGVGKTTFSRVLSELKYSENEENRPVNAKFAKEKTVQDFNILVFNQDFINANFQQPENLPGVFILNETNIKLHNSLKEALECENQQTVQLSEKNEKKNELQNMLNDIDAQFETDCWNRSKVLREKFSVALVGSKTKRLFARKLQDYSGKEVQDLEQLQSLYQTIFYADTETHELYETILDVTLFEQFSEIDKLKEKLVGSSDTNFSKFVVALKSTDWLYQGHKSFHESANGRCPYCQQILPPSFEEELAKCFDDVYQSELRSLAELEEKYTSSWKQLYERLNSNLLNSFITSEKDVYREKMLMLNHIMMNNIKVIQQKQKEPGSEYQIEPVQGLLQELNELIDIINRKIAQNNEICGSFKTYKLECIERIWNYIAYTLCDLLGEYQRKRSNLEREIKNLSRDIIQNETALKEIKNSILSFSNKMVNTKATVDGINKMLKDSGFQGFVIREHPEKSYQYQIVRGNDKCTIASRLSEGEKNFIAFLYFCCLVHGYGTVSGGADARDKIVVIDDPISSMDSNALFIVSALVKQMIELCLNNMRLWNKKGSGEDYIKQLFILTHNAFFHREISINYEKNYETVSFFLITKLGNKTSVKLCIEKNPEIPTEKRNYNPVQNSYSALWSEYRETQNAIVLKNVIRRIMEYYFIQICGYNGYSLEEIILEKNRSAFVTIDDETGEEDMTELRIAASLLHYISSSSFMIGDDLLYIEDNTRVETYKTIMNKIFSAMGQSQHYDMMNSCTVTVKQ